MKLSDDPTKEELLKAVDSINGGSFVAGVLFFLNLILFFASVTGSLVLSSRVSHKNVNRVEEKHTCRCKWHNNKTTNIPIER